LKLESVISDILQRMNNIEGASLMGIHSLEVEKERMKMEIGA